MSKLLTLANAREMSDAIIWTELMKRVKQIEALGVDPVEVHVLVNSIMNLGIAMNERNLGW
jgi:hypothetical protein